MIGGNLMMTCSLTDLQIAIGEAVRAALSEALPGKEFFTRQEVAEKYNISLGTVHNWMNSGKLRGTRVGGRTLFSAEALKDMEAQVHRYGKNVGTNGDVKK